MEFLHVVFLTEDHLRSTPCTKEKNASLIKAKLLVFPVSDLWSDKTLSSRRPRARFDMELPFRSGPRSDASVLQRDYEDLWSDKTLSSRRPRARFDMELPFRSGPRSDASVLQRDYEGPRRVAPVVAGRVVCSLWYRAAPSR
nr:hypothetical protein [Tanacetum cinerariifolium]